MLLGLYVPLLQHYFDILCIHSLDEFKPFYNKRKPNCLLQAFPKDGVKLIEDEKNDLLNKNVGMACLLSLFCQT